MLKTTSKLLPLAAIALFNIGCATAPTNHAMAVVTPTAGNNAAGVVDFTQTDDGVHITAEISGLTPGDHGFHIHEWGDISKPNGKAEGGHLNLNHTPHGARDAKVRHTGDLGNITADARGVARYDWTDPDLNLALIIGRGVIVHAKPDDYGQPTGNAGARVAQGVVGVAKEEE